MIPRRLEKPEFRPIQVKAEPHSDSQGPQHFTPGTARAAKWTLILAACLVLYALVGFLIAPPIFRAYLDSTLSERLRHPVTVKEVGLNPFTLSLTIRDLAVWGDDAHALLGFEELYVNAELMSVINWAPTFSAITLRYPFVVLRVDQAGRVNLLELFPASVPSDSGRETPAPVPESRSLPSLFIERLHIDQGIVEFHDESRPTPFAADLVPVTVTLRNFSTVANSPNTLRLAGEMGPGERIEWEGSVHFTPMQSTGTLRIAKLGMRSLWEYVQDAVRFEIADGILDVSADYDVGWDGSALRASLTGGTMTVAGLRLTEKDDPLPLVTVPLFEVTGIEGDLGTRRVGFASLRSRDAHVIGWIDEQRRVNVQELFASAQNAAPVSMAEAEAPPRTPSWSVTIGSVSIENYSLALEDRQTLPPVRVEFEPVSFTARNLSNEPGAKAAVALSVRVNDKGMVTAAGSVVPAPLTADMDVQVSHLQLPGFQPYVDQLARLSVESGAATLDGHVSYRSETDQRPVIRFTGQASVTELRTKDRQLEQDFLKWDALHVRGLQVDVKPMHIGIAEVVAQRPYLRFIIGQDRTTNVSQIMTRADSVASEGGTRVAPAAPGQGLVPIQVEAVRLIDGSAHFADYSVEPSIDTGIEGLRGGITGLSSQTLARAAVRLRGNVGRHAPVSIDGRINPLSDDPFTDVSVRFKNVDLTVLSPYAMRFAGYAIKQGKASVDLQYQFSKSTLEAENKVVLEQLTLGDKVESPDATSLPVKLAVALLKDRNGVIHIDLPVRGNLQDPEFQYGRVLVGALMNVVKKAAMAPFQTVARLVGGDDDELSAVPFPVGDKALTPAGEKHLAALAKALHERPELRLEVAGAADAEADRIALANRKLTRELISMKAAGPRSTPPQEDSGAVQLTDAEEADLIRTMYAKRYGKVPAREAAPPEALKDRLLQGIAVDDDEIRDLGRERARQIEDYLVVREGIPPERIYVQDVNVDAKAEDGRVAIALALDAG
ncbi:DUF748 domain-containing protein [Nitrospira moscoviensis]|uniref:DUF748 domain-containing protein n=1 Tax=Nitrospira moscoviensis TaxID=42253 RepID=A0A0K2GBS3_NITMO|nr:DUF748 domain-containing protein [Nitrospira moscoviensis]ALA58324.1 hypothetical protein NITMOv2_1904 [Nitrospira moscoviensis]